MKEGWSMKSMSVVKLEGMSLRVSYREGKTVISLENRKVSVVVMPSIKCLIGVFGKGEES